MPPLRDNLLIIAVFMALLLAVLLLTRQRKSRSDYILAALFGVYALTLFLSYMELFNQYNDYPLPGLLNTSVPLILLHGPLLWLYTASHTRQQFRLRIRHLVHALPFLFVVIAMGLTFFSLPAREKIRIIESGAFRDQWLFPVTVILIALTTQGYYIWGLVLLTRYRRKIKAYFSRVSGLDLKWLRFVLLFAIASYAGISGIYLLNYLTGMTGFDIMQSAGAVLASCYILILGFFGLKQEHIFSSKNVSLDLEKVIDTPPEPQTLPSAEERFINRLLQYMKEEKPYLEPELTIAELSKAMDVRSEYLSRILNSRLHKNFFDFINHYRIEEFKQRCQDPVNRNLTLMSIAWDCGFSSKATFNRVFRNATHRTPAQYYREVSGK